MDRSSTATLPAGRALEGATLDGRFFLQRWLGGGNFGDVYLAEQRVFGLRLRRVAVKLLRGEMVHEGNAAEVLNDAVRLIELQEEEGRAEVARHLVTVYDAGFLHDRPGQAYVVMEHVSGRPTPSGGSITTLEGLIRAYRPVPVALAVEWMTQILRPLAWMHTLAHPVLHCDLKPDNILVCGRDLLKVADFGLAQLAFGLVGSNDAAGALTCQAPETLLRMYPTPASDVYSLGLIFYEMLAGRNPLDEAGLEALADKRDEEYRRQQVLARQRGLPSLLDAGHPELADEPLVVDIVERCLRVLPNERFDDAASLLRALESYAQRAQAAPSLDHLLAEAKALFGRGRLAEARARCEQARAAFPGSSRPCSALALVLVEENRWQEALQVCARGMAIDPHDPEVLEAAAAAREVGGQPDLAREMRRRAMELRQRGRR